MSSNDEKTFQEKADEIKDNNEIKNDEEIIDSNEKKANVSTRLKEKRLELKKSRNEKRLKAHINLAEVSVDEALEDADSEIDMLSEEIDLEIENEEGPQDLILYKACNILEEILLRTKLRIQMAKNEFIANLQDDLEDGIEVAVLEENIAGLKEKTHGLMGELEGKIAAKKDEFKEKYGDK